MEYLHWTTDSKVMTRSMMRVRLDFKGDIASVMSVQWGFTRVVLPVDESCKLIGDILYCIAKRFQLQESKYGMEIYLGEFILQSSDYIADIIQSDDVLIVKYSTMPIVSSIRTKKVKKLVSIDVAKEKSSKKRKRNSSIEIPVTIIKPKLQEKKTKKKKLKSSAIVTSNVQVAVPSIAKEKKKSNEKKETKHAHKTTIKSKEIPKTISPLKPSESIESIVELTSTTNHIRFDAPKNKVATTNPTIQMNGNASRKPFQRSNSIQSHVNPPSRSIPCDLMKYGPSQPKQTKVHTNFNKVIEPTKELIPKDELPFKEIKQTTKPTPSEGGRDIWKRPYTVIASIHDNSQTKEEAETAAFNEYPLGDVSVATSSDIIAYKSLSLCEKTFQPIESPWQVGEINSRTENELTIQMGTFSRSDKEIQWTIGSDLTIIAIMDISLLRWLSGPSFEAHELNQQKIVEENESNEEIQLEVHDTDELLQALRMKKEILLQQQLDQVTKEIAT